MKAVKLVTQDYKTRVGETNETLWEKGKTVTAKGSGGLCTDGVIHSYVDEYVAAFMNPVHANIKNPRCIVLETSYILHNDGTKQGSRSAMWTGEEVTLPIITTDQRVEIAIRASLMVYDAPEFVAWALHWIDGTDRSAANAAAASAAANTAWPAAYAANAAAAYSAADAAYAYANTAWPAAYAAYSASAAADAAIKDFNLYAIIREVIK
jgi:hypothetical protein